MSPFQTGTPSRRGLLTRHWRLRVLTLIFAVLVVVASVVLVTFTHRSIPEASLADARTALARSSTVSIIGDSTGNDSDEWVALWAAKLGVSRRVELRQWLDGTYSTAPISFGDSGERLTIWNASKPGGGAAWAGDQLGAVQPQRPDLVIFNLGHNNISASVAGEFDQMHSLIIQRWGSVPQVVILQNPSTGELKDKQAETLRSVATWAASNEVPTIDVTSAFTEPARLLRDEVHPNPQGSRVWAEVVADALG